MLWKNSLEGKTWNKLVVPKSLSVYTSFHRYLGRNPSHSLHLASVIFRSRNGFNSRWFLNLMSVHTILRKPEMSGIPKVLVYRFWEDKNMKGKENNLKGQMPEKVGVLRRAPNID